MYLECSPRQEVGRRRHLGRLLRLLALVGFGVGATFAVSTWLALRATASTTTSTPIEDFSRGVGAWTMTNGSIAAASDNGQAVAKITYDLTGGPAQATLKTPFQLDNVMFTSLSMDVQGDGTFNTIYAQLRDASGELLTYRMGNLHTSAWVNLSTGLGTPFTASGGDSNKLPDGPLRFIGLYVTQNAQQPATGSLEIGKISAAGYGWTPISAEDRCFDPTAQNSTALQFNAGTTGSYAIQLSDAAGHVRSIAGSTSSAGPQSVPWNGRSDNGVPFVGLVQAVLRLDEAGGDTLAVPGRIGSIVQYIEPSDTVASQLDRSTNRDTTWVAENNSSVSVGVDYLGSTSGSTRFNYDVSTSTASIQVAGTPVSSANKVFKSLAVDYKGDGTQNPLYVVISDANGERFTYLVGSLASTEWRTAFVNLATPGNRFGGDTDARIDLPVSLVRMYVARSGSQPSQGNIFIGKVDALGDGWTVPSASTRTIVPGQQTTFSFVPATPGTYTLSLRDPAGRTKTFSGTTVAAQTVSIPWNGRDDTGSDMKGSVSANLAYSGSADANLPGSASGENPFAVGVALRLQPASNQSPVGINADINYSSSYQVMDQRAQWAAAAHTRYVREELAWTNVEPRDGTFTWNWTDNVVAAAQAYDLSIIGRLGMSAPWASSAPSGTPLSVVESYPPRNLDDYIDYVKATVARYKDRVHVWEIWNEPNGPLYWRPAADPIAYSNMLKRAYVAIKAIDPTAVVLSGGIAGFDFKFMEQLRAQGALAYMDGFGLHTFVDKPPMASEAVTWLEQAKAYLAAYAPKVRIWITEFSWSTCTPSAQCSGGVTEAAQAQYLSEFYAEASSRGVAAVVWFDLVNFGSSGSKLDNYGLIDRSGRMKPAYAAFSAVAAAMEGHMAVGPGVVSTGSSTSISDVSSTADWSAVPMNGATADFTIVSSRHGGVAGGRLAYTLPNSNSNVQLRANIAVPGKPAAISFWTYGDNSATPIYLKFTDATGEQFSAFAGQVQGPGWARMTVWFDQWNRNIGSTGGNADGTIDFPITLTGITMYRSTVFQSTGGRIFIDDFSAHYGTAVHSVVLAGAAGLTQLLASSSTTANVTVSVGGGPSAVSYNGTSSALAVASDGTGVIDLSPLETAVSSTAGPPTPTLSGPSGAYIRWVSADTTVTSLRILNESGTLIRQLRTNSIYDAGLASVYWDGRNASGDLVGSGTVVVELKVQRPDGDVAQFVSSLAIVR